MSGRLVTARRRSDRIVRVRRSRGGNEMAPLPLLYVHGAGPQQPAPAFKHEADMILFGRDMPTTKVAHYSEVRWPPAGSGPTAAPNRAGKTRRVAAIRGSMAPQVSPTEAADAIVS